VVVEVHQRQAEQHPDLAAQVAVVKVADIPHRLRQAAAQIPVAVAVDG
jgi:hypothetical protein